MKLNINLTDMDKLKQNTTENAGNGHSLHPMLANGFLNELANQLHTKAKAKGFWDEPREIGTLLMLIVSELSEALEADRNSRHADFKLYDREMANGDYIAFKLHIKDTFEDEIADTFIRLFDLVAYLNIDIEKHIRMKMEYNQEREYRHGKAY